MSRNTATTPQDNNVSVTTPRGLTTTYVYNGFGQVIQVTSPDTGTTVYHLPTGGQRHQRDGRRAASSPTGRSTRLTRVTSETYPASPGENIAYSYDSTVGGNYGVAASPATPTRPARRR